MEPKMLQVGDRVIESDYRDYFLHVIDRVTATQACAGKTRLHRKIEGDGRVNQVGRDTWSNRSYWMLTPELLEKYRESRKRREIYRFAKQIADAVWEIPVDRLEAIHGHLKEANEINNPQRSA